MSVTSSSGQLAGRSAPSTIALTAAVAVIATTGVWLATASITATALAGVLNGALCGAAASLAVRRDHRLELHRMAVEALAPLIGQPPHASVSVRRWRGRGAGTPARVVIRFNRTVDENSLTWRQEVLAVAARVFDTRYVIRTASHVRHRLLLVPAPPDPPAEPTTPIRQRADKLATKMLGETAEIVAADEVDERLRFTITLPSDPRLAGASYQARIERTWSAMMPGRWAADFDTVDDRLTVFQRPQMPRKIDHPEPTLDEATWWEVPLGVAEDGRTITWFLRGTAPHMMVVGATGSGKTVVINGAVMECCSKGWPVWICDPKRVEFMALRTWPNVQLVATSVEDQIAVIYRAHDLMMSRYAQVEAGTADEDDFEPQVVVLDEYRHFVSEVTDWYSTHKPPGRKAPSKCPVFEKVADIARLGRTARVHLILGTQRPDAAFLSEGMRDSFVTRVALGRMSPQGAQMMWDSPSIGLGVPAGIPGRGTGSDEHGAPTELQAYWTPDPRKAARSRNPADLGILERLRPSESAHRPLRVVLAEEHLATEDLDGNSKEPNHWQAVIEADLLPTVHDDGTARTNADDAPVLPAAPAADSVDDDLDDHDVDQDDHQDPFDPHRGYQLADDVAPTAINPGDLVLVDETTDSWATVTDVEPDVLDDSLVCVSWRDADDQDGQLQLGDDDLIARRAPTTDADQ